MRPSIDIVVPSRGASSDRTRLLADIKRERNRHPGEASLVVEEGPNVSTNRNQGASRGAAPWIVFLDDDVRLPDGWLSKLLAITSDDVDSDVFSGQITSTQPNNVFAQAAEDFVIRHKRYAEGWYLVGVMLVIKRESFQRLGGFDEMRPFGGEDWALCQRAHGIGLSVKVHADLTCAHTNPTTLRGLMRRASIYGANEPTSAAISEQTISQTSITNRPIPLVLRIARWPVSEYAELRKRGRGRVRSLTSTALYIPWMARYLWARRSNVAP